ncbi:MAG: hypothetical protein CG441_484 [Methylococcaceae bacterium NSM2-1]|nr:MAG: hypothetical protein CG441_484 [Methylococcaceae bacterium NSM2-1]
MKGLRGFPSSSSIALDGLSFSEPTTSVTTFLLLEHLMTVFVFQAYINQ